MKLWMGLLALTFVAASGFAANEIHQRKRFESLQEGVSAAVHEFAHDARFTLLPAGSQLPTTKDGVNPKVTFVQTTMGIGRDGPLWSIILSEEGDVSRHPKGYSIILRQHRRYGFLSTNIIVDSWSGKEATPEATLLLEELLTKHDVKVLYFD